MIIIKCMINYKTKHNNFDEIREELWYDDRVNRVNKKESPRIKEVKNVKV